MTLLMNQWARNGHHISLVTFTDPSSDFFQIETSIERHVVGLLAPSRTPLKAVQQNWSRVYRLRQLILNTKPDLVISAIDKMNVLVLLALRGKRIPILISEHTEPRLWDLGIWEYLRRISYPWADGLVVLTREIMIDWGTRFLPNNRIFAIPYSVTPLELRHRVASTNLIVAMGRLNEVKRFDLLIQAFARCHQEFPEWRLRILGEGSERQVLERLIHDLNLVGMVDLPGSITNIGHALSEAEFFVLSSRVEGLPNVLLEAMSCGIPVIATSCSSGPREIVREGVDGLLVPPENVDALAAAMRRLMSDPDERARLAARAPEVRERFSMERVLALWDDAIRQSLARRH